MLIDYLVDTGDGALADALPLLFALAFTTAVVLITWVYSKLASSKNHAKSPLPPLCEEGLLDTVMTFVDGTFPEFLIDNFKRCGPIYRLPLLVPGAPAVVVVCSPEDVRTIYRDTLSTKPSHICKGTIDFSGAENVVGLSGGDSWYHRRHAVNPAFSSKRVRRMHQIAKQIVEEWITKNLECVQRKEVSGNSSSGTPSVSMDIGREMVNISVSVICQAAFGYSLSEEESAALLEDLTLGWAEFAFKSAFNPLRQFGTWILPERQQAFLAVKRIQEFAKKVVAHYRLKEKDSASEMVIDMIMKNPSYSDDKERYADIIMILFAGHDTTGFTAAFTLLELAKNPAEQEKLRGDLLGEPAGSMRTGTKGAKLSFLKCVIKEAMRMHPVAPVAGFRTLGRDMITKQGGFLIPKRSTVLMAQCVMVQDQSLFENPGHFEPLRWMNITEDSKKGFVPFALGSRNCFGQPLANAELEVVLSRLVKEFQFTVEDEGKTTRPGTVRLDGCILKVQRA